MDRIALKECLSENVRRILPHKSQLESESIVEFLFNEGVKKETDLRRMTIQGLKAVCDTVDASDLYEDWQSQYAVRQDQSSTGGQVPPPRNNLPSTSRRGSARSQGPLTERNTPTVQPSQIPTFDVDSPYIPAKVRQAIKAKKRPEPNDRYEMVRRIADHVLEVVPNFGRPDFDVVADSLVDSFGPSFKDTLPISEKGSDSLREQFKIRFDNLTRNPDNAAVQQIDRFSNRPEAYGCLQYSPALPSNETDESQLRRRENLRVMFDNSRRHRDWRKIKADMDASFYLLRRDINGPPAAPRPRPSKRRRIVQEPVEDGDDPEANADRDADSTPMTVVEVKQNWPCLFTATGMNHHMLSLTGSDFQQKLEDFLVHECKLLIDLLSSSSNQEQGKTRRLMLRAEARGDTGAPLAAFLKMAIRDFGEQADALVTFVEATVEFEDVDVSILPQDKTPHLVVAGTSLFEYTNVFLAIDGHMVSAVDTLRDAFIMLFSSYFIFGIAYPTTLASFLTYVQKAIANIQPERGTKCSTNAVQKKANTKATKLHNKFITYKDMIEREGNEENAAV